MELNLPSSHKLLKDHPVVGKHMSNPVCSLLQGISLLSWPNALSFFHPLHVKPQLTVISWKPNNRYMKKHSTLHLTILSDPVKATAAFQGDLTD